MRIKHGLSRFRLLAPVGAALGVAFSVWGTSFPGWLAYSTGGCYSWGWVTWVCSNPDGYWVIKVPEFIDTEDQNVVCGAFPDEPEGPPAFPTTTTCNAIVHFTAYECPDYGPPIVIGTATNVRRSIPNGCTAQWCQDPG
jgi:hypothetical protein